MMRPVPTRPTQLTCFQCSVSCGVDLLPTSQGHRTSSKVGQHEHSRVPIVDVVSLIGCLLVCGAPYRCVHEQMVVHNIKNCLQGSRKVYVALHAS